MLYCVFVWKHDGISLLSVPCFLSYTARWMGHISNSNAKNSQLGFSPCASFVDSLLFSLLLMRENKVNQQMKHKRRSLSKVVSSMFCQWFTLVSWCFKPSQPLGVLSGLAKGSTKRKAWMTVELPEICASCFTEFLLIGFWIRFYPMVCFQWSLVDYDIFWLKWKKWVCNDQC